MSPAREPAAGGEDQPPQSQTTRLLTRVGQGDEAAREELFASLYGELHRLAGSYMGRQPPGHTLQPTALVHEAWLKLVGQAGGWADRAHFFRTAAKAMRSVLVDSARARGAAKRGGDGRAVTLDTGQLADAGSTTDTLELDEALARLEVLEPGLGQLVELRFFGGLTVDECAGLLDVSRPTVERRWRVARTWLRKELGEP